jgi:flagellin
MTTGYKINHAKDNAAGYSIARNWEAKISSLDIAAENAATGSDMLATLEDNYALVSQHLQRVRDLTEQASNGTYGTQSKDAIESEITARLEEIDRIAANCEFNGIKLMAGSTATGDAGDVGLDIQVGIDGTASKSRIHLDKSLFANGKVAGLFANSTNLAKKCSGQVTGTGNTAQEQLSAIDTVISTISERITTLGAARNRIDSAVESISVQSENITSSLSTLRDADVATESSNYIKAQILQQASATLLATANQTPSIALNLL